MTTNFLLCYLNSVLEYSQTVLYNSYNWDHINEKKKFYLPLYTTEYHKENDSVK